MNKIFKNHHRWLTVSLMVVFLTGLLLGCRGVRVTHYFERGALATAAPIATGVGETVFARGGNACDAAVAVGFALAVVHPEAGNIGGGGFALIHDGASGEVRALDFRETAPAAATEEMYLDKNGEVIENLSTFGAKAAGVPGTVAGFYRLWEEYGTMPWEELVTIAAALADTGYYIDAYLAESFEEHREALTFFASTADIFYPDGRALKIGERLFQKDLSRTLYLIAAEGPDGFYKGQVAESLVKSMTEHGGLISLEDLENYGPVWREPIHFVFDSLDIYSMPPPSSGGIVMGQILKLIEPYDFSAWTPATPEYIHLFCEASRLAFADRATHLGDADFYPVPDGLLDESYLQQRRSLIIEKHASSSTETRPGSFGPANESEETTHFSICDQDGNMVSITYTLNTAYGSKLVVEGGGFLLNNEMDDFSIKPGVANTYGLVGGEANKIEPGKRMLSSMSPTLVLRNDRPYLALGSPGGSKIITVVAQAIVNCTRFGLKPVDAAGQPRFHHQWLPDQIYLEESGFDINTKQGLISYGHNIQERTPYSDLQMVFVDDDGLMYGVADPRKRGSAGGY